MRVCSIKSVLCVFFMLICTVHSAKILGIFYVPSKSHHILGSQLFKALAKRGHQVTMISPFSIGKPMENYTEIVLDELLKYKEDYMQDVFRPMQGSHLLTVWSMIQQMNNMTITFWQTKPMVDLVNSNEKYDLVIMVNFANDLLLALAHKLSAPSIILSTLGSNMMTNKYTGNPTPYSYVMTTFDNKGNERSFFSRLKSTVTGIGFSLVGYFLNWPQESLRQKYLPDTPPIEELVPNVSLVLLNSHYSVESIRPYLPNMVQIGGFHISEPKELPKDIKDYLDGAKDGAVFFSLGSNVKLSQFPDNKRNTIIKVLGRLKQKVLMKSDEIIENLPKNVRTGKWFPQNDILAHPNVNLFITHGGLLSTLEAVYHGVPLVGLPCFGDQMQNMDDTSQAGYAIKLDILTMTEENFYDAIKEILENQSYRENIQIRSSLLREQPMKPMDKAIFWVEHVIKHKGAAHLRSPRLNLYLYQYLLLDVVAFLVVTSVLTLLVIYVIIKLLCKLIRRSRSKSKKD